MPHGKILRWVIELTRSNKIHENLMKTVRRSISLALAKILQRNVVENKNMVKGVITF